MPCPRCEQEDSVEQHGDAWVCRACTLRFTESTKVVRPLSRGTIWVERGTGNLVRVLEVDTDPFDPHAAVRFTSDTSPDDPSRAMLARDFRHYFRFHEERRTEPSVQPPCKPREEWESITGVLYLILDVNSEGSVHVVPSGGSSESFWVKGADFMRQFRRLHRLTDYARLLGD